MPANPHTYASGKSAQEAHEAIRPTDLAYTPERVAQLGLQGDQLKLYTLIYQRFVASQMSPAVFAVTNVEVLATPAGEARGSSGLLKAQGKVMKFDGYRKVLPPAGKQEDATLPSLAEKQKLDRLDLTASQHFTQPPPRYNEASLVKALEKEGIGRPSTYATIIHKITSPERGYVEVKERRFFATKIGKDVTDLLIEHFPRVMELKFTSHMEEELDQIETRQAHYNEVLNEFWGPFSEALKTAEDKMPSQRGVETGEMCPQCGKPLVRNYSKKTHRYFVGCSGFKADPPCKFIKPEEGEEARPQPVETEHKCPTCGKTMLERMGKSGPFLGCSGYPECKTTMNFGPDGQPVLSAVPTAHTCEKCSQPMVLRQGKRGPFLACTGYPKCKNAKDVDAQGNPVKPIDTGISCEKCGSPMAVKKGFRGPFLGCSNYPKCRSTKPIPAEMKEKLKDSASPAAGQEGDAGRRGDRDLSGVRRRDEAASRPQGLLPRLRQVSQVQGHARGVAGTARTVAGSRRDAVMRPRLLPARSASKGGRNPCRRCGLVHLLSPAPLAFIQFTQTTIRVEHRRRQRFRQAKGVRLAESLFRRTGAAEDRQSAAKGDDLAPCSPFRSIRPAADALVKVEEHWHDRAEVTPIARIIRLDEELPARNQRPMDEGKKGRRDETQVDLARLVVRLWMVAVDLGGTVRRQIAFQEADGIRDGEADVGQAALVGPPGGVADDDRQHINAEVIVVGPPDRTAQKESAVARAEIDHERGGAAEQCDEIERTLGREFLEGGLRPQGGIEDLACERHAELALDVPAFLLVVGHGVTTRG